MSTKWEPRVARQVRRALEDLLDRRVSQTEMAGWMGYSRTAIQGWEAGRYVPDPGVQFIYHKLIMDPGFIAEVRQWSSNYGTREHETSEAPAGQ